MKQNHIVIRPAQIADIEALRRLFLEVRRETFHWEAPANMALEDFDRVTEGELVFVAIVEDEIAGFISIWEEDRFIHNLFVRVRGFGVGKALIQRAGEAVGWPLTLKCVRENKAAKHFYLSQGWKIEEEVMGEEPYDLMRLDEKGMLR